MEKREVEVKYKEGLHLRPASQLVTLANGLKSEITIEKDKIIANPKSLLSLISAQIGYKDIITIKSEGKDEVKDMEKIINFLGCETIEEYNEIHL